MEKRQLNSRTLNQGRIFSDARLARRQIITPVVTRDHISHAPVVHRQFDPPKPPDHHIQHKEKVNARQPIKKKAWFIFIPILMVFIIAGISTIIMSLKNDKKNVNVIRQVNQYAARAIPTTNSNNIDEIDLPAESLSTYKVAPEIPKRISIEKLGVNSRVVGLSVKINNELLAPTNIHDTGWYLSSAKPGEQGATLIVGHEQGPSKPGVFSKLKELTAGDKIVLERGDGKIFNYKVSHSETYEQNNVDMAAAVISANPKKSGLNLVTAAGKYNTETKTYEKQLVVFAVKE